jgi:hypothetical protein
MNVIVTISDLSAIDDQGSVVMVTGTAEGGDRVTFAGPPSMGGGRSGSGPRSSGG